MTALLAGHACPHFTLPRWCPECDGAAKDAVVRQAIEVVRQRDLSLMHESWAQRTAGLRLPRYVSGERLERLCRDALEAMRG